MHKLISVTNRIEQSHVGPGHSLMCQPLSPYSESTSSYHPRLMESLYASVLVVCPLRSQVDELGLQKYCSSS